MLKIMAEYVSLTVEFGDIKRRDEYIHEYNVDNRETDDHMKDMNYLYLVEPQLD